MYRAPRVCLNTVHIMLEAEDGSSGRLRSGLHTKPADPKLITSKDFLWPMSPSRAGLPPLVMLFVLTQLHAMCDGLASVASWEVATPPTSLKMLSS